MFIDIFESFRKANAEISDALSYAYPDNKLDGGCGAKALCRIEGIAKSLQIIMQNKYESVEKAEQEEQFRSVYSEFEPTDEQQQVKDAEEELGYVVNWDSILTAYPNTILRSVDFWKKNEGAMHAALQGITGKVDVMNLFLKAITR